MAAEPVDATAEEVTSEPHVGTELARRERRSEVIRPLNADQLAESFAEYQSLLPKLLNDSDYQDAGKDKHGNPRRFVKKSGWRKIATAFDLDVQIIRSTIERDEHGKPARAEVWARAIAPSGRSMDGDGYCSVEEERFGKPGEEQWKIDKARAKLENDLRATATTRAKNRAISDLVGMGEVSAEEVSAGHASAAPAWMLPASDDLAGVLRQAVAYLLGNDSDAVDEVMGKLTADTDGTLVAAVARAVVMTASKVRKLAEASPEPETDPPAEATVVDADEANSRLGAL